MIKNFIYLFLVLFCPIFGQNKGFLEEVDGQKILHLKGTPYERGFQHGQLTTDLIKQNLVTFLGKTGGIQAERSKAFLENLPKMMPFIPSHFIEEMQGIADGAGVEYKKILLLNLFPEMFHCSGITVKQDATKDKRLYHVRVLDYAIGKNLQNTAVLMVVEPEGKIPYLNVSYAGFIGSVTGMNNAKISIGEIGGLGYGYWEGMPMAFLIREILEKASTLEEAKTILSKAQRTCEYYYVISDGKIDQSVGVYATASQIHFIEDGSSYALLAPSDVPQNYGPNGDHDKFFLASCSLEDSAYQTIVKNDKKVVALLHKQPTECLLLTGFPYPERYPVLAARIKENYGQIDEKQLMEIIKRPVARDSNLHNAIFLPSKLEIWIAHAGKDGQPACDEPYHHFCLTSLLSP